MRKINTSLKDFINNKNIVSIERKYIDKNKIISVPIKLSKTLLLIKYCYDFIDDGFKIIRLKDISAMKQEKVIERINKIEGFLGDSANSISIPIEEWRQVFCCLLSLNKTIIIECEYLNGCRFYIGKILKVKSESVEIITFDGKGKWDKEASIIKYKKITCVTFDDRYSIIMGRYALNKKDSPMSCQ
jgi:hypothetical protein